MKTAIEIFNETMKEHESYIMQSRAEKAIITDAMEKYAEQEKEGMKALMEVHLERADKYQERIEQLIMELDNWKFNSKFWQDQHKDCCKKYNALITYVNERKI